jgi:hypothetical protein
MGEGNTIGCGEFLYRDGVVFWRGEDDGGFGLELSACHFDDCVVGKGDGIEGVLGVFD